MKIKKTKIKRNKHTKQNTILIFIVDVSVRKVYEGSGMKKKLFEPDPSQPLAHCNVN